MIDTGNLAIDIRPYLKLLATAFLYAIDDAWSQDPIIRDPARQWIQSNTRGPISFLGLCDLFDLEPDQTRSKILYSRTAVSELRRRVSAQDKMRRRYMNEA